MHREKRLTLKERVAKVAELAETGDYCLVWCETNDESNAFKKALGNDFVEVIGSDKLEEKEAKLEAFASGNVRGMVTKASIAGFGLNLQHCCHEIFGSISYSYEQFYQAIRRIWRFGQLRPCLIDVIIAGSEYPIWKVIQAKLEAHDEMKEAMRFAALAHGKITSIKDAYNPTHKAALPSWIF